jgi:hypothetical protein
MPSNLPLFQQLCLAAIIASVRAAPVPIQRAAVGPKGRFNGSPFSAVMFMSDGGSAAIEIWGIDDASG